MKILIATVCLLASTYATAADFSGGLVVGTHNGFAGKLDLAKNRAIAAGLSFAVDSMYGLSLHADYLFEKVKPVGAFNLYFGGGLRTMQIRTGSEDGRTRIGARAPVGLTYSTNSKVEFFGEAAPVLYVVNNTGFSLDLGVGVRFQF